ncbi:MAG TPA: class I SAM-dependent methyltransferase [Candidatus Binatia bacterium]|nr:class I SAM-dependent methyltransferase [Candidatus Binatia bacterium]
MAAPTAGGLVRSALFHYLRLLGNGYRAIREVEAALAAAPDERVLDFACGCGWFCLAVPGDYVGIDLDAAHIRFARWRWGSPRRRFEALPLDALPPDERFDKAMMVSALHHLSDPEAAAVLSRLVRLVRRRLVVVDLDPDASRGLQSMLLARDRGGFVRPPARQRALLAEHFTVIAQRGFRNTTRTVVHTLFICEPPA